MARVSCARPPRTSRTCSSSCRRPIMPTVLDNSIARRAGQGEFRFELARKAFAHTAQYDSAIASTLSTVTTGPDGFSRVRRRQCRRAALVDLRKIRDLRYGENPHQRAALYQGSGRGPGFELLQGKELSYTNLLDLDAAARIVSEFDEPAAVVIKHTNPCGAATGSGVADAYVRARDADSLAAFGGIVGFNRSIDEDTAPEQSCRRSSRRSAHPRLRRGAKAVLADQAEHARRDSGCTSSSPARPVDDLELRSIVGGVLVQTRDVVREAHAPWPGSRRAEGGHQTTADGSRSGKRCGLPGGSAHT